MFVGHFHTGNTWHMMLFLLCAPNHPVADAILTHLRFHMGFLSVRTLSVLDHQQRAGI